MTDQPAPLPTASDRPFGMARQDLVILIALLALAAAARLWWVGQPLTDLFSWRQVSTAMIAHNIPLNGWNIFFPEVDWTGPGPSYQGREFQIYTLIVALVQAVTGLSDTAGRLVSAMFGLLTVFSLHRLTARMWSEPHAHAAALIYALMPAAVMMDTSFLPDAAMLALLTTGTWLYARYFSGEGTRLLVLAGITFCLGVLAKLPGLGVGLVVAYLTVTLYLRADRKRAGRSLLAMAVALAAVIAYYAWAVHLGTSYPPYHVAGSGYIWDDGPGAFYEQMFYLPRTQYIATAWFYGWPILALLLVGLWTQPWIDEPDRDMALAWAPFVWLLAAVIVYIVAAREISQNPWNLHLFSVPIALFAGAGLVAIVRLGSAGSWLSVGLRTGIVALAVLSFSTVPLLQTMKAPFSGQAHALGVDLAGRRAEGDLVITIAPDVGDPVAIYYAATRGWVFPRGGGSDAWSIFRDTDEEARAELEALRAEGARWFGYTTEARDDYGRMFVDHHAGFVAWLDMTFAKVADTPDYAIYHLDTPAGAAQE